jgi:hypothetical protein
VSFPGAGIAVLPDSNLGIRNRLPLRIGEVAANAPAVGAQSRATDKKRTRDNTQEG